MLVFIPAQSERFFGLMLALFRSKLDTLELVDWFSIVFDLTVRVGS